MFRYESHLYRYEDLVEKDYLTSLQRHLVDEMGSSCDRYNFVIWSDHGQQHQPESLMSDSSKPRVLLYISDETSSIPSQLWQSRCCAIFKSYLPTEIPERNLFALPLGYASGIPLSELVPVNDRRFNVFFSGSAQENRARLGEVLLRLAAKARLGRGYEDGTSAVTPSHPVAEDIIYDLSPAFPESRIFATSHFLAGVDRATYGAFLAQSKIALCPKGWQSSETFRHFEAMRAGCIMISDRLPSTRLYQHSPIIQLDDWNQLEPTVMALLSDRNRLAELQKKTIAWWDTMCSERAVAAFIRKTLSTK